MSGKFIVIEGLDSSGKKTQAHLLLEKINQLGKDAELITFPTYQNTKLGAFVSRYLKGDFGDITDVTPEVGSLLYAIDRYQFKDELKDKIAQGKIIVADRYTTSNIFQAGKASGDERFEIWKWVKQMESRIAQPDIIVFLNVTAVIADKINQKQDVKNALLEKGEKDIHERDVDYMERVRQAYMEIAKRENWIIINCVKDGILRSKEDISNEIFEKLKEKNILNENLDI